MTNRRSFLKQAACVTGACLCGFSSLAISAKNNSTEPPASTEEDDKRLALVQEYLGALLLNMQGNLSEEENRKAIKQLSLVHYKQLNMDEVLKPYENNLDKFIDFLEKEWGWKVSYNKGTQLLTVDENKNYCVCPMINQKMGIKPGALCFCSEGFAERMFSKVAGCPVKARVVSSIHRGDARCKYHIDLS